MIDDLVEKVRADRPDLLDWDKVSVKVIKDPQKPLSVVSELGVVHAGLDKDSAIWRLRDARHSFILKWHFDAMAFRRETANIAFVNQAGQFAPQIHYSDPADGTMLMEDLGDHSLAYVWNSGLMDDYVEWVYEAVALVLAVQGFYRTEHALLRGLYEGLDMELQINLPLAQGLTQTLNEVLQLSRGCRLEARDQARLRTAEEKVNRGIQRHSEEHKDFVLDLASHHIIRKDGRIRVIDLTAPAIGSVLFQFSNIIWHLDERREILRFYLKERDKLGPPYLDHDEFLRMADGLLLLVSVEWIRNYCREIIEGEHSLTDLEGSLLTDYEGPEASNLQAIYRALEPYEEFKETVEVLQGYFSLPLKLG